MKLATNFLSLAGAEVVSKAVTFAAFAYLGRVAGAAGLGHIEFAMAVFLCASLATDLGFNPYGAREIARARERTAELVSEIVFVRLLLGLLAFAAVWAIAYFLDRDPMESRLLWIYGLGLIPTPLLLQWVFQGHDRMHTVAIATLVRQTVFAVTVFAFVRGREQIWYVAIGEVAGILAAVVFFLWSYRRAFGRAIHWPPRITSRLFREGVPIGVSQVLWAARMFGGTLVVGFIASSSVDVGLYGSAQRVLIALHAFVFLYFFNLLPSMTRAWHDARTDFTELTSRSLRLVAWVACAAGAAGVLAAPDLMALAYGSEFRAGGGVLRWFAGVCVLAAISGHYRFGLIAAGRQNAEMCTAALGLLVAVIAIFVGYAQAGPVGAAAGLFLAELAVWASSWAYARRLLGVRGHALQLLGPAVSFVAIVCLGSWFSGAPAWLCGAAGGAIVAALGWLGDSTLRDGVRQFLSAAGQSAVARGAVTKQASEGISSG